MNIIFVVINILLLTLVGILFVLENQRDLYKLILFSCISVLLLNIITVMVLAIIESYALVTIIACDGIYSVILGGYLFYKRKQVPFCGGLSWSGRTDWYLLLFTLLAAVLYFGFPTKDMIASRDPGLYLLNGVHIAREGKITYDTDDFLNDNYEEAGGIIQEGYPGLFSPLEFDEIEDGMPGDISVQFMPMFPSALAIGYSLCGMEGLIRVNGVIAILSILLMYYFARDFLSAKYAGWILPLLLLNPAQLWGGRLTESEILAQLLYFLMMYVFIKGWEEKKNIYFIITGFLLGISVMNRIDSYIYGMGLWVAMLYCSLWKRSYVKYMKVTCALYVIIGGIAFLYGMKYSTAYFIMHFQNGTLSSIILCNLICLAVCCLAELVFYKGNHEIPNIGDLVVKNAVVRKTFFGCCFAAFLVLYFVRPRVDSGFTGRAAVEFTWYTSFVLMMFAIFGIYKYLEEKQNSYEKMVFFFAASISSVCLYIINPSVSPDHIWAGRRWVSVCIPFILLYGVYGLENIRSVFGGKYKIVPWVLLGVCVYFGWRSSPFLFKQIMPDMDKQYEELAAGLSDDDVYLTSSADIAAFLRFMYGKRVYRIDDKDPMEIIEYLESKKEVKFLGDMDCLKNILMFHEKVVEKEFVLEGPYLMECIGSFPKSTYSRQIHADINRIRYRKQKEIQVLPSDLSLMNSVEAGINSISAADSGGLIFFGPYLTLEQGTYELRFQIENNEGSDSTYLEVTSNLGQEILLKMEHINNGANKLIFELPELTTQIEFKLYTSENSGLICRNIWLEKLR